MKQEAKERKLHRMAKVHDFLEMWLGSQNLCTIQNESRTQNRQITAVRYISDTEEIIKASWSLFQHDGAAAYKLSERSPLPPSLSAKNLPGGLTQILNVCQIRRIYHHPVQSNEVSLRESILDTENCLNWNGDLDNPDDSEDNCAADNESDIDQNNVFEDLDYPEQQDMSAAPDAPGLVQPTQKSKRQTEKLFVTVNEIDMRRNQGAMTK